MPSSRSSRPASPSAFPTASDIVKYLKDNGDKVTRRDIARAFNIKGEARAKLRALLNDMESSGTLDLDGSKRFRPAGEMPPVLPVDVMSADDDGDLLCMPASWRGETSPPMIRLPMKEANRTKPLPGIGDRLLVRLTPAGDDSYTAKIIKPLGKGAHRFLAVFRKTRYGGMAEPVERRARNKFTIDRDDTGGASDGDLVWVEAAPRRGSSSTQARVREVAGHVDDRDAFSLIALANHNIPVELPADVIAEAEKAKLPSLGSRTDLRNLPLLTIDPADAKDHDDAVWATPDEHPDNAGGYKVIVAIADVSWFVRPGSRLDAEAQRRGNSVYLPDRVVPMLPERLSNDLCSLREHEDRPCLAVEMILTADGRKKSHRFMRAMMRSAAKLSYEAAQELIDTPQSGAIGDTVTTLKKAFDARWSERTKRAPLDLDLPERKITLGPDGSIENVTKRERFDAHRLIEEFMILANISAAETLETKNIVQIYRAHDRPDDEKLESVRTYLESLNYSLIKGASVRPSHFNQLLKIAGERNEKEMVSEVVLRSQSQAVYSIENVGHFGLNLARYSHFTSPIRRYADLTIHRALVKACKLGEGGQTEQEANELKEIAERISDLERRAMAAERESKDRFLAAYHADHVGEEFAGRIRGVTRFGLFVALDSTGADGFIPMRTIGVERFRFEEELHAIIGETTGAVYRLGQSVTVRVEEATPVSGGLRLELTSEPALFDKSLLRKGRASSRAAPARGKAKRNDKGKPKSRKTTGLSAAGSAPETSKATPQSEKPRSNKQAKTKSAAAPSKAAKADDAKPAKTKPKRSRSNARRRKP